MKRRWLFKASRRVAYFWLAMMIIAYAIWTRKRIR